jgi:hypothetical protein
MIVWEGRWMGKKEQARKNSCKKVIAHSSFVNYFTNDERVGSNPITRKMSIQVVGFVSMIRFTARGKLDDLPYFQLKAQ